jgi:hypothetical protein
VTAALEAVARAFEAGAGELGMHAAAWLVVEELAATEGDALVREARDRFGRAYAVLDAVCERWLHGDRRPAVRAEEAAEACEGAERLLAVGLESEHLDALVDRLPDVRFGLVPSEEFPVDWERVLANYDGRLERVSLADVPAWGGRRSALLAFVYGMDRDHALVPATWLRVIGPDVRAQQRAIVAWDVLGVPLAVHPRRLFEAPLRDFTRVVGA